MTKEGFEELQLNLQQSGMNLKTYLKHIGTNYSTYNYWRKKYANEEQHHELAPISIKEPATSHAHAFVEQEHSGATLLFPNGLRAHFGAGTEDMLMEILTKSLTDHVLP